MNGEQKILIGGLIVVAIGVTKVSQQNTQQQGQPSILSPVLIGGLTFIVLLALFASINPQASNVAGNFALLAAGSSVLLDLPGVLQTLQASPLATNFPGHTQPQ